MPKKIGLVSALSTNTIFRLVTYADATREATIAVFMVIVFEIVVIVLIMEDAYVVELKWGK